MDTINEETTYIVTISFFDQDGNGVVPDQANYRLDDEKSGTVIKGWTAIQSLSESVDVVVSSDENAMVDNENEAEIRILTVSFSYGGALAYTGTSDHRYLLLNLTDYPNRS